jgi:hypothetical protein
MKIQRKRIIFPETELIEMANSQRGIYRHQSGGWRVKIVRRGERVVDELFSDRQYGGPLHSFAAAMHTRDNWLDHLGLEQKPRPRKKQIPSLRPKIRHLRGEETQDRDLKFPMPSISRCTHEGEDCFKASWGRKEAFFSVKKWTETGARQFAEAQLERWQKRKKN